MPFPVPHESVPIVNPKTGKCTWEWMQYFAGLQGEVGSIDNNGNGASSSAAAAMASEALSVAQQSLDTMPRGIRRGEGSFPPIPSPATRRIVEVLERHETARRSPPADVPNFVLPVGRNRWSESRIVADTEANLTNYPSSNFPESCYLATDTWKTYYSGDGSAWTEIYYPALIVMFDNTTTWGALASGQDGGGLGITASRLGDNSAYADHHVLDEAYGATWNANIAVPTKNAVYDKIQSLGVRVVPMADATSFTPTGDTADMNTQANTQAAGNLTANAPSGTPVDAQMLVLRIKSTNVQTFVWNAIYRGGTTVPLPTVTSGGGLTDYFFLKYNAADSTWDFMLANLGY